MIGSLIIVFVATMMKMGWFVGLNEALAAIDPTLLSVWGRGNVYEGGYGVIAGAVGIYSSSVTWVCRTVLTSTWQWAARRQLRLP